jgi:mono/diheme cytochrome c family protein
MPRRRFAAPAAAVLLAALGFALAADEKPKFTIKEVMQKAHNDGLLNKIKDGKGTKADKERLLELYSELAKNRPPRGDEKAWKQKCEAIVAAAKEVLAAKNELSARTGIEKLDMAVNCQTCHTQHRRRQGQAPPGDGKYSISEVMQTAHAGKENERLIDKVWSGRASKSEKEQLVELYSSLPLDKPVRGEIAEWKERTEALLAAAKAVANGEKGAEAKLGKAANCAVCHSAHRNR